ncbi:hypothetical protein M407DRAFT_68864 [Tulasnella calospora MUT 4182]|uniref:Sister chromatid cohesion protein DCC1 n=1 Tax=Tulasnella calospora MUT 4182 TaxID=1051891 RepID=A0A0C3QGD6_9AGAM|nr:hypothetical protein M407DRAFT_68864 [Tulasnella calospora MUT 4182]
MSSNSFTVKFPAKSKGLNFSQAAATKFKLVELTPELAKIVEAKDENALKNVTIRGKANDEAVLCTRTTTYCLRTVQLSNSFLVVTGEDAHSASSEDHIIRDTISELIELVPAVPKLERLGGLLKKNKYRADDEDGSDEDTMEAQQRPRRRFTYNQVRGLVQASDVELERGLREKRVLQMDGYLQPLPSTELTKIISYILTLIPKHSWSPAGVPLAKLTSELLYEYEVPKTITRQVCEWFGLVEGDEGKEKWVIDQEKVVTEVGLGVLQKLCAEAKPEKDILTEWKDLVGDQFESIVRMDLLEGNFLDITDPQYASRAGPRFKYFPASGLPAVPAERFKDLFLTKTSWKGPELTPFLQDIAVEKKERDRLLMKFTRTSTDASGIVWYSSRAKY